MLTFVVVGGGPTNIEFASELHDFLMQDVAKCYTDLLPYVKVVVVEASGHILGTFKSSLVDYVEKLFQSRRIEVRTNTTVNAIEGDHTAVLGDGSKLPFGMMVWSTGIKQVDLIRNIPDSAGVARARGGRLVMDSRLRIVTTAPAGAGDGSAAASPAGGKLAASPAGAANKPPLYGGPIEDGTVYAMGDCACDSVKPLPALAQVAAQQGKYLARVFNEHTDYFQRNHRAQRGILTSSAHHAKYNEGYAEKKIPVFKYSHLGSMASVGEWKGVVDTPNIAEGTETPPVTGTVAFLLWRAAYWTKQVSLVNKFLIPMYWFKSMVFGRDISRF